MREKCGDDYGTYAQFFGDNLEESLEDIEYQFDQNEDCIYQLYHDPHLIGLCEVSLTNPSATMPSPTTTKRELKNNLHYKNNIIK